MKFHVHVYRVKGMIEVDTEAKNEKEAQKKALDQVKNAPPKTFKEPDCNCVAVGFPAIQEAEIEEVERIEKGNINE